ncbi:FAD-dependent oxidoreductase [Prosthecochloris sp. N3]|uniref:FAD-dependent oxidoreductase n=1 Tax=Prosthecochloris ethylica TaxID=2743976 RepID=A0ABR9XR57_9CHLB|nr:MULTISPECIES: FAD-dependent oxidoreductase [Prosthecochloris]MEC9486793.1 FAD-dependent oxidoreductase [Prosthecochloris sp.]MBF0585537.1 FAD-dependent oxidoreductase [Prosthecochloris ethylica]MBF0636323.1 FAD-dependent oxidoreductase [Prosthecochloris ethylica]NUK46767.1 FAD-dependent oxidoreductase [Prosthecochloris ethylica]RNA64652.1 FAD-dependent oxidoreductase [Prosthecochloris sp. ZM_2]
MNTEHCDVAIIGGGPAGCSAAIYTARADLKTVVIDKDMHAGALGMAHIIANYPGMGAEMTGMGLLEKMRSHAESFGASFFKEKVNGIDVRHPEKTVYTTSGRMFKAKALILATGSMGKSGDLPGEKELLGAGVSYCATCDAAFYHGKQVAVAGRTREAVEEAMVLARFASRVLFFCPASTFTAPSEDVDRLAELDNVEVFTGRKVKAINGERFVESVRVSGPDEDIAVDGVFLYLTGSAPVLDYTGGQLDVCENGCLLVDERFRSSVEGVFVAGDILCKEVKQVVVVASEGCRAALEVERYLRGRDKPRQDYH